MRKIFAVNKDGLDKWEISVYPDGVAVALAPWTHGWRGGPRRFFKSEEIARASVEGVLSSPPIWVSEADFQKVRAARDVLQWEEPGDRSPGEIETLARELEGLGIEALARELRELFISEALDLTGADLAGADLTGADLAGADLSGADLTGADLTGAELTGADLTGANLSGAKITPAQLREAILDEGTQLDLGLRLELLWAAGEEPQRG